MKFLQLLHSISPAVAFVTSMSAMDSSKPKLIDVPVSYYGARCRFVIYEKKLESEIDIASPADFGGMKSEDYKAIHSAGKVPGYIDGDMKFGESDTIVRHLIDKYSDREPSFVGSTLTQRTLSNRICRHVDTYLGPLLFSFYKATLPFGPHSRRLDAIEDLKYQLKVLEDMLSSDGPFMTGSEVSLADAACIGFFVFVTNMAPKFSISSSDIMGPKLESWWDHICKTETGRRILREMEASLKTWEDNGRWTTILHAGYRDTSPETVFDKILRKEIPSTVVYEDQFILAFKDINPVAPVHILIIPKARDGLTRLSEAQDEHSAVLGKMMVAAATIAKEQKLQGFRLVVNDGPEGGQVVYHLHMHLIGGRQLSGFLG